LIEICQLLEAAGFVVSADDHSETVLLLAGREGNPDLLRLVHAKYRYAFVRADRIAACIAACTANPGHLLAHFRVDWNLPLHGEDPDGHSILRNGVAASAASAARCCLNMGGDPNAVDSAALLSPRTLAVETGDKHVLELFAPLRYLPQIEMAPGNLMISGHVSLLTSSLLSTAMRRGEGKRIAVLSQSERRDERTPDEVIEVLCSVKSPRETHACVACENCPLCRFRLPWQSEACFFHIQVESVCMCCLRGRTPAAPPSQKVQFLLPRSLRSPRLDGHFDVQHPAKVLAKVIFLKVPASLERYLTGLMHYTLLYCLARTRTPAQSLDDVIGVRGGRTTTHTLPNP
jgi:hypothetical protein